MATTKKITKAAQREATTQKLIEIGREIFTQHGYAQASTEEIVQRAGVTRGALYHHFASKEGLFHAVLEDIQKDVTARIEEAAAQTDDLWGQLLAGCRAFLTASLDPQVQRIMLMDGPAVLGWEAWRQIDAEQGMQTLHSVLLELTAQGLIHPQPINALVHVLSGAMNEAALWIAGAEQPEQAFDEATATLENLLSGLRKAPGML
ncbi:MAG: TetR/AcrR family transcriptional regulator [Chitinophagaceae bacterium]|nr:TetR/AcrR family transcriptional regulator [Anaerolineae bacterium]